MRGSRSSLKVGLGGYKLGQGKRLKSTYIELQLSNQRRKLSLELSLSQIFYRIEN